MDSLLIAFLILVAILVLVAASIVGSVLLGYMTHPVIGLITAFALCMFLVDFSIRLFIRE